MSGYYAITKKLEGRYVELKSKVSGKVWKGKIKHITIGNDTRRILFDSGREVIAHKAFIFTIKSLEGNKN